MSGTYGNFIPRENRQPGRDDWNERRPYITNSHPARRSLPGQDDWNQLRPFVTDSRPAGRYLNPRGRALDPRWFFEDRQTEGPSSLASSSSPAPTHTPIRFLLIENDTARNTYPTYRQPVPDSPPPRYYEPQYLQPSEPESKFTKEEQEKGLNKLRKVMYNPHLSNIVRRLGMRHKTDVTNQSGESRNFQDDDGKRCAVCLEDFDSKQFVMLTPCDHMFHEECIVPWVKSQGKCPVCRFVISERIAAPENNSRRAALQQDLISLIWEFDRAL
ncbi:Uncharacterized protein Adt_37384 [Abeliophyllum distichum]|uniref:RING-type E3 ubiquitin transferase n=1 Tax=Abeliophyllum distichum TaxID=126358 RepID=A0ABD1QMC3_9LAMI